MLPLFFHFLSPSALIVAHIVGFNPRSRCWLKTFFLISSSCFCLQILELSPMFDSMALMYVLNILLNVLLSVCIYAKVRAVKV